MTVTYAVQALAQWINIMSSMYQIHSAITSLGLMWSRLLPHNDSIAMELKYKIYRWLNVLHVYVYRRVAAGGRDLDHTRETDVVRKNYCSRTPNFFQFWHSWNLLISGFHSASESGWFVDWGRTRQDSPHWPPRGVLICLFQFSFIRTPSHWVDVAFIQAGELMVMQWLSNLSAASNLTGIAAPGILSLNTRVRVWINTC